MEKSFETAEELYTEGKSRTRQGYEKAQKKIDEIMDQTGGAAVDSWEEIKDYCRKRPAQAVGIAVATGALIGLALAKTLSSRRESSVEDRFQNVMRSGQETWGQVKSGFDQALNGLKRAMETFRN